MPNYSARVLSNALQVSKAKGTPYVAIQCEVLENLENGEKPSVRKTFVASLWLTENAKLRTVETLKAIGFSGSSFLDLNNPVLEGLEIEISTEFEDYNGESRERVAFVNAPGTYASRGVKPCGGEDAMKIAAQFDALLRMGKAQASAPAAAPSARPAPAAKARPASRPAPGPWQAPGDASAQDDALPF